MPRLFELFAVKKTSKSKAIPFVTRYYTGNWQGAAKKAMSSVCREKKKHCLSPMLITLREVTPSSKTPILDADGREYIRTYRLKRVKRVIDEDAMVPIGELDTSMFKYETLVLKSFGRQ